ncbi:hypothetical protein LEP1GSC024_1798 [Leptospira noguchii str. 2001034031]|uniref:Uncharacterized protein n=1 Tax=Leptospira noguchii str. 2001034031 TaxID=1193053 RepID=M6YG64_9LEPT|nr:hypothetical protein LEP1GSC024_1798 [Leptospira noguchii str. 2001034031]
MLSFLNLFWELNIIVFAFLIPNLCYLKDCGFWLEKFL